jgi:hypothetical protein
MSAIYRTSTAWCAKPWRRSGRSTSW